MYGWSVYNSLFSNILPLFKMYNQYFSNFKFKKCNSIKLLFLFYKSLSSTLNVFLFLSQCTCNLFNLDLQIAKTAGFCGRVHKYCRFYLNLMHGGKY